MHYVCNLIIVSKCINNSTGTRYLFCACVYRITFSLLGLSKDRASAAGSPARLGSSWEWSGVPCTRHGGGSSVGRQPEIYLVCCLLAFVLTFSVKNT